MIKIEEMLIYDALNMDVLNAIPNNIYSLLDVGCGSGQMGLALKQNNSQLQITGLTYSEEEKIVANQYLDSVLICDLNSMLPKFDTSFDCIVFSHILEHTYDPSKVLFHFKQFLSPGGKIIIALPNILYYKQRIQFLKGYFVYSKNGGLMDITHFRFFDWNTTQQLIVDAHLKLNSIKATGNFPLGLFRKVLPQLASKIDIFFLRNYPGLYGFQFIVEATT